MDLLGKRKKNSDNFEMESSKKSKNVKNGVKYEKLCEHLSKMRETREIFNNNYVQIVGKNYPMTKERFLEIYDSCTQEHIDKIMNGTQEYNDRLMNGKQQKRFV